jgi:hypothetical protein
MEQEDLKLVACTVALSSLLGVIAAVGAQRLIGDRRTVLLSASVLCAGAIARGLATGFAAFTAGVFVNGVGVGLALTIVPDYAAELSPSSARRVLAAHPDGLVYLGCILGSVVYSIGFSRIPAHLAWRLTVAIGTAAPALLSSVVLFMPETPRWLVSRDRESKARRLLNRTSATLEEAELRLLEIKVECGKPHDGSDEPLAVTKRCRWWREELGILRELLVRPTEPLRRAVLTALVAKVFQQASSTWSILQYVQRRRQRLVQRDGGIRVRVPDVLPHVARARGARLAAGESARPRLPPEQAHADKCRQRDPASGADEVGEGPVRDNAALADGPGVDRARSGTVSLSMDVIIRSHSHSKLKGFTKFHGPKF